MCEDGIGGYIGDGVREIIIIRWWWFCVCEDGIGGYIGME